MERDPFVAAADAVPCRSVMETVGGASGLVVVAPHPDDESLGCGALLAAAAALRVAARVVIVSDGCMSHPKSRRYPRERLRKVRQAEARAAAEALGLKAADVVFLDLPDAAVPTSGPQAERAVEIIVASARDVCAAALFVTWRHDRHCDHQAAYGLAREAQSKLGRVRLFEYSIWGRGAAEVASLEAPPRGWRLPPGAHRERKRAAIESHASQVSDQIDDDPEGFRLSAGMIAERLERDELFLEMAP